MSLEEAIRENTAAVRALTEALGHTIGSIKSGQPGRTEAEIAAEYARATGGSVSSDDKPADAPKGRGRPVGTTKDKAAPQQSPATQAAASAGKAEEDFDPFGDEAAAPARTYTIAEITTGLKALHTRDAAGKAACLGILTKLGVKGVGEIPEAKFAEVAEALAKQGVTV